MVKALNLLRHVLQSLAGVVRELPRNPSFVVRLVVARIVLFFGGLVRPLEDPYGYPIRSASDLVHYWLFFIARDFRKEEWAREFCLADKPLAVDVGANVGIFCHVLNIINPTARIIAVEPQAAAAERIRRMAARTKANVTVVEAACSDVPGTVVFYSNGEIDTAGSVEKTWNPHGRTAVRRETRVPAVTVDSVVMGGDVFIVIVDVEGHEESVLRGAGETLKRTRWLVIEDFFGSKLPSYMRLLGPGWRLVRRIGGIDCLVENTSITGGHEVGRS